MRGKLSSWLTQAIWPGLIPACAGKTNGFVHLGAGERAHPRVCGENPSWKPRLNSSLGSSPRVRGKPCSLAPVTLEGGLIPACAGKTLRCWLVTVGCRAHPRVCGENAPTVSPAIKSPGSSPRVRGKRGCRVQKACVWGLIPACAGKTSAGLRAASATTAHPRVCGENTYKARESYIAPGSSPRVRGKRFRPCPCSNERGLIPACAGKTAWRRTRRFLSWAHPRVCGENSPYHLAAKQIIGSSPRVRGKRCT